MDMKLLPLPYLKEHQQSYENILTKVKSPPFFEKVQMFKCVYEKANLSNTVLNQILTIDGMEICKLSFQCKIECNHCSYYNSRGSVCYLDSCGYCHNRLNINFTLKNVGKAGKFNMNVSIEKPDLSVKEIFDDTKSMLTHENYQHTWQFERRISNGFSIYNSFVGQYKYGGDYFSQNGNLTFICNIKVLEIDGQATSNNGLELNFPSIFSKLAAQFSERNINPSGSFDQMTDVILCVGDNKIYCHKFVLGMTSGFFEKMFTTDMKESKSKEIVLKEIDLETITSLLKFMYTDTIEDEKVDLILLAAADMYEIMRLREICIKKLSKTLNLQNVLEIWLAAHKLSIVQLAHDAVAYMACNWDALTEDESISEVAEKYPDLVFTISTLIARK